ncbi:hypothetical protein C7S15_4969 [Burkholderia cepacia]|nr:hypothetical protein [Burkholderia cepacia]
MVSVARQPVLTPARGRLASRRRIGQNRPAQSPPTDAA